MTSVASPRLPAWVWPLSGMLLLTLVNAGADLLAGRGLIGPGCFLHLAWREGVPSGAVIDVLNYGSIIAILAVGMVPVIALRGVDLSVGAVMAISGCVAAQIVLAGHASWLAILAALACGACCGVWNGLLVTRVNLQPFVATLILMVCGRGIAQMLTAGQIATFHDPVIEYLGLGRPGWLPLPVPFLLALGLLVAAWGALRQTAAGLLLEASGSNPVAARLAGVRTSSIMLAAYVFCGICAAVAGLIAAANIKAADPFNSGRNAELGAIFAAVVGGTSLAGGRFSLIGTFIGALLMQSLTTTMYARNVGADVAPLPQAGVILAVCIAGAPATRALLMRRAWRRA
jgi:galactofuranose transport system permease protein